MTTTSIFLSYRREDSEPETRIIQKTLKEAGHNVFMDRTGIELGEKWPYKIRKALENSNIVIAVIGDTWLTTQYPDGRRRIDGEEDWVRLELRMALDQNKTVIPVLINRASMPTPKSLPEDLKELSSWQALSLSQENWESDIKNLLEKIVNPQVKPKPILLLTSKSDRRKELLKQIGWEEGVDYFTTYASVNPDYSNTDTDLVLEDAKNIAEMTVLNKIDWVKKRIVDIEELAGTNWNTSNTILIGVDTIVFCQGKILDRPLLMPRHLAGPEDIRKARDIAKKMLEEERGKNIHVITSLAIGSISDSDHPTIKTIVTGAELRSYSDEDIANYIRVADPLDKAGAFGIQDEGIALFKEIKGSYTNIVGLPLAEFVSLVEEYCHQTFSLPELKSSLASSATYQEAELSVACIGDINYDFVYDEFPEGFFAKLQSPGSKINGPIHRGVGGTAVNFAKGAKKAGFARRYVVGILGGDELAKEILKELNKEKITPIIPAPSASEKTSIAIIFRDTAMRDTSITVTDSHQLLPKFLVGWARDTIKNSDVFYCSGYCLMDKNRRDSAIEMMEIAKLAGQLVVLDIPVGMHNEITWEALANCLSTDKNFRLVDVIVSELPEIFGWFHLDIGNNPELKMWKTHKVLLVQKLREKFQVAILRTSSYTHEIVLTSDELIGPQELDYQTVQEKVGYGDFRTAKQMYSFLSPRIVLASKSPQRLNLLNQIVSPSKIQVVVSNSGEERVAYETPYERVKRLALEKADAVFIAGKYHHDIELIIGADTEIIRKREDGEWDMIGHPQTVEEAIRDLSSLRGKSHFAITGMALIGKDPKTGQIKKFTDVVETKILFDDLSPDEIEFYAETREPIARAGAYAIQGLGTMLIRDLDGSYSNVVGLPLERLCEVLADEFNKPIWLFDKVSNWTFPSPIRELR
jgi:septum formation protein